MYLPPQPVGMPCHSRPPYQLERSLPALLHIAEPCCAGWLAGGVVYERRALGLAHRRDASRPGTPRRWGDIATRAHWRGRSVRPPQSQRSFCCAR